jgi:nitrate reductase delta subunit
MRRSSSDLRDRAVWQAASVLLDYPDDARAAKVAMVRALLGVVPPDQRAGLDAFADHVATAPLADLQERYVASFDEQRRCSLYLTYFTYGDTRKRGTALLRFKQAYLESGVVPDDSELPDHLGVVLEFAATADPAKGRDLLLDHRASIEALSIALHDLDSPWAPVLDAVRATFPALQGDEADAVRRLIADGPPAEEVGLGGYGTGPDLIDLPMPAVRAAAR